ncbi:MAG: hypothetical protein Q8Q41_00035 [bacterium]|nr:hypothetical protein [bacterium]
MHKGSVIELLTGIKYCLAGKHNFVELLAADAGFDSSHVVRWCRHCGAAAVDVDCDGRTDPGRITPLCSPEFVKKAIALLYRQLLGEILNIFRADRVHLLFGIGYDFLALEAMSDGRAQIPAGVAAKISFLAVVIARLEGAYTNKDICAWFERPRVHLGGRSPAQIFSGEWEPSDPDAQIVLELARALSSSPAT